ncbi:beta-N-acetylhexosaminidase [Pontibacter sp. JH31]|uniref:beta-N-acetylhexosaminidase n=1 Tax=Pontibacter aquaedesilientis TaxID=2766980 RepID=A0ABR7XI09_9BACT|nr:beta-N-acetylhexosaminidase [Pontibacter aquaedesilientis]MBD1397910.1 beta-N-acetylhexosaminidase [Pontibacter aquaedesilientis]
MLPIRYRLLTLVLLLGLAIPFRSMAQSIDDIMPIPVEVMKARRGHVTIDGKTQIVFDRQFADQAVYLRELLAAQTGLKLKSQATNQTITKASHRIRLVFDTKSITKDEMYTLTVSGKDVTIRAKDTGGVVYGIQTLLQLFPLRQVKEVKIPDVTIRDYPRFAYRGMHLDVVRHMFPLTFIKKYIDYLAFHKMNTFHWHLTDDQGWRIEIESYPKLNTIGSWRDSTLIGHFKAAPARYDGKRYGGFYTKNEVREVIRYAAVRGITIIPEIDIPGHSRATIAAYPEFSTRPDTTWNVAYTWGMYNRQNNVLQPNPATFQFLKTVFQEVAELFPGAYFHLGGDETSKMWWKADPVSQAFIKDHKLKDEKGLQTYFVEQVAGYLAAKGKKVIGWHEILEGDLNTTTLIMNWGGEKEGIAAAKRGHQVIMSPGKPLYFDHYQSKDPNDSLAIHGYNPVDAVYAFEPIPDTLHKLNLDKYMIGAQGNVWTEYMGSPAKVEYMIFPRMTALSEVLWSPKEKKDYEDFKRRLKTAIIPRYTFWKASYFPSFEQWTMEK